MSTARLTAAVIFWPLTLLAQAAPEPKADPREELATAVPEAIRLLEAKDYAAMLKAFIVPEEFKKIVEDGSLDALAKFFGEKKSAEMLQVVKSIEKAKPVLDAEGKTAT